MCRRSGMFDLKRSLFTSITHTVILRNAGRRSATNVRLRHHYLPDFNVWPSVQYHTEHLPERGTEIVIPVLVSGEQITISYLYFSPVTVNQINDGIKSDQGFAQQIPVLLQQQYAKWVLVSVAVLLSLA